MSGRKNQSQGFTLITTLILLFLLSGLAIGMLMMVNTEVKVGTQDVQNNVTFHAAEGGIEKMTSDLGNALNQTLAPTAAQIQNLAFTPGPPAIAGITFPNPGAAFPNGGYTLTPVTDANGNIIFSQGTTSDGLNATLMNVQLQATAQGLLGDEVSMNRTVEMALVPVFQFGIFCEGDCGFFAGPNFNFGGRVHANGDLYLAEGNGATLTFSSKVEAYGNVVRQVISNGNTIASGSHAGTVLIPMVSGGCPGAYPSCGAIDPTEGSVVAGPTSAQTTGPPSWQTISLSSPGSAALPDFNGFVIDGNNGNAGGTGAKKLTLPFVQGVAQNLVAPLINDGPQDYEIIRRATAADSATLSASRLYNLAQIRVLLSDNADELPCGNPSTAPAANCGSADAQNVRLANVNDGDNGFDTSHGVKQSAMPLLASGDNQSMYFATANSAIANPSPNFYSNAPASTQVSTDWEFGPLNPFPSYNIKGTAFNTNTIHVAPGNALANAPYMLMDATATRAAITKAPPQDWLVQCNIFGANAVIPTQYTSVNSQPAVSDYCPNNGAYPYYSLTATATGTSGYPALTLPYPNPQSSSVITTSAAAQSAWNLLDGYIRVEYRDAAGNYHPVTQEWLGLGFARALAPPTAAGADPISPTAILRLQQPADRNGDGAIDAAGQPPAVSSSTLVSHGCQTTSHGTCIQWYWNFTVNTQPAQPPEVVTDIKTNSPYYGDFNPAQLSPSQYNWYPINFYDIREGEVRDGGGNPANQPANTCTPNGIMNAVEIDVGNLKRWLSGAIGASGGLVESQSQNGYLLYFSDRRGMLPNPNGTGLSPAATAGTKTGDSGLEDVINSGTLAGTPDGNLEAPAFGKPFSPEDPNLNGFLDNWGAANLGLGFGYNLAQPQAAGTAYTVANNINSVVNAGANPNPYMTATANRISSCGVAAQGNWVSGARHVLKVTDASLGNLPLKPGGGGGFSIGSENPVYVQGDYNSNAGDPTWGGGADAAGEAASAIIADSVTFLSDSWSDWNSILKDPINLANRPGTTSYYRMAVAAGKNINFPYPNANYNNDYGTDGGVHNFLRYLESWGGTLNYKGSIANLFYSTYATGIYKCCNIVYSPPTRNYIFDNNFTTFQGLPPGTPTFRDIDNLSYRQSFTACNVGANGLCTN